LRRRGALRPRPLLVSEHQKQIRKHRNVEKLLASSPRRSVSVGKEDGALAAEEDGCGLGKIEFVAARVPLMQRNSKGGHGGVVEDL